MSPIKDRVSICIYMCTQEHLKGSKVNLGYNSMLIWKMMGRQVGRRNVGILPNHHQQFEIGKELA